MRKRKKRGREGGRGKEREGRRKGGKEAHSKQNHGQTLQLFHNFKTVFDSKSKTPILSVITYKSI